MTATSILIGHLTRDPEIRSKRDGHATASLRVAVERPGTGRSAVSDTASFEVVCWRDLAEHAALWLAKAMRVVVTGRLESHRWGTGQGERRHAVALVADDLGPSLRHPTATVKRVQRPEAGPAAEQ